MPQFQLEMIKSYIDQFVAFITGFINNIRAFADGFKKKLTINPAEPTTESAAE